MKKINILKKLLGLLKEQETMEDLKCICGEKYDPFKHPLSPCVAKREWDKLNLNK